MRTVSKRDQKGFLLLVLAFVILISGCLQQKGSELSVEKKSGEVSKLDSNLRQLCTLEGNVVAIIELKDDATGEALATKYPIIIQGTYQNLVQALIPLKSLCEIADDESVIFIRRPEISATT